MLERILVAKVSHLLLNSLWAPGSTLRNLARRSVNAAIGAVEDRVRRRKPLRVGAERVAARMNTPRLQLSLRRLLGVHRLELEFAFGWDHHELRDRLTGPKNMRLSFGWRFAHHEIEHRPPTAD